MALRLSSRFHMKKLGENACRTASVRLMQTQKAEAENLSQNNNKRIMGAPSLPEYYTGKNLFITGATGFCGKPIIEKLLRSCPGISGIYCLTRSKAGISPQDRLQEIFNDPLFDTLKSLDTDGGFRHKVHAVEGDIAVDNLGMQDKDRQMLKEKVNIVIHSAASVNFNDPLPAQFNMNVKGSQRTLDFSKSCKNLESHLHMSTAFSNANRIFKDVKEEIYVPRETDYEALIEKCRTTPKEQMKQLQAEILGDYPNTYTFTKGMAEFMVGEEHGDLPVSILRPSGVTTMYRDPLPGWIDSTAGTGIAGITNFAGKGALRVIVGAPDNALEIVPADVCTNSALAAVWKTAMEKPTSPQVYNVVTSNDNPCSMRDYADILTKTFQEVPMSDAIRPPAKNWMVATSSEYWVRSVIDNWIPALYTGVKDMAAGKKPMTIKYAIVQELLNKHLSQFLARPFYYDTDNFMGLTYAMSPKDSQEFFCDPRDIYWPKAISLYGIGIKKYINKQELPEGRTPEQSVPVSLLTEEREPIPVNYRVQRSGSFSA